MILKYPAICPYVTFPVAALIRNESREFREEMTLKIINKFKKLPNTEYFNLWIQRLFFFIKTEGESNFKEYDFCSRVKGKKKKIWNSEWLGDDTRSKFESLDIINTKELKVRKDEMRSEDEVNPFAIY